MATPEGKIKSKLDAMLKAESIWYFSPQAGPYGVAGIPDRIAIVCGLFLGIEVKADAKCKMTALQERCKKNIVEAGGYHFLVYDTDSIEQVRQFIIHVRASRSRQEGGSCVLDMSRDYPICDTHGPACTREFSYSSAQARGNPGSKKPRVLGARTNPILL